MSLSLQEVSVSLPETFDERLCVSAVASPVAERDEDTVELFALPICAQPAREDTRSSADSATDAIFSFMVDSPFKIHLWVHPAPA